jgi:putative oxidoreductase
MSIDNLVVGLVRFGLVGLFLPASALDKIIDFKGAVKQAAQDFAPGVAHVAIIAGIGVEIFMSLSVLTGVADRMGALILAVYCVVTACLFKRFWLKSDFWAAGDSQARTLFWDFLKNFSVASGFLLIVVGPNGADLKTFIAYPLASSAPYSSVKGANFAEAQ